MSETLTAAIIGAIVGILATLLTIFLTPRLQHYFWKRQRLAELRFEAVDKINWLMADFITEYIAHEQDPTTWRPSPEFFKALQVATAQIRALFSDATRGVFKELEVMIGPRLGAQGCREPWTSSFAPATEPCGLSMTKSGSLCPPPEYRRPRSVAAPNSRWCKVWRRF